MKKLPIAVIALCALASCSKSEVSEVSDPQEIFFQTITTKAASPFSESNKFYSFAYFLEKGKSWDADKADSSPYIKDGLISYDSAVNAWKNADVVYYWPKEGTLTFFSWTDNTSLPSVNAPAVISCTTDGIQIKDFDVTTNRNKDILVADIAKDQSSNDTQVSSWKKGVATIFRHAGSSISFTGKTKDDYGSSATFQITDISFNNVETKKDYNQGSDTWSSTSPETKGDLPVVSPDYTLTKDEQALIPGADDYTVVLPQDFTDDKTVTITYTITTNYGVEMTQTITVTKKLSELYGTGTEWEDGKKYNVDIILGLEEIYWAPSVEDWNVESDSI